MKTKKWVAVGLISAVVLALAGFVGAIAWEQRRPDEHAIAACQAWAEKEALLTRSSMERRIDGPMGAMSLMADVTRAHDLFIANASASSDDALKEAAAFYQERMRKSDASKPEIEKEDAQVRGRVDQKCAEVGR